MHPIVLVGVGGFIGAVLRYLMSGLVQNLTQSVSFPHGTFVVNITGCFLMGNNQAAREIPGYALTYLIKTPKGCSIPEAFSEDLSKKVLHFDRLLPGYQPTHLIRLRNLAQSWGVAEILIKDESTRFGLGAFKVLIFNTEGATDPESYREILWHGKYPSMSLR